MLDNRPAEHSFSVIIPEGTKSCILTYRADIISQTGPYENHIVMGTGGEGGQGGSGNSGSSVSMGTGGGGGGAAATRKNKGIVSLTKTDSLTGEAMAGVDFQLLQDGQPVARGVTDGGRRTGVSGPKAGEIHPGGGRDPEDYIPASLKVTSPEGLAVAGNQVEIELTGESKEIVLALTDDPVTVNVEFWVMDEDGNPLEGQEFTLNVEKTDGTFYSVRAVSGKDGRVAFGGVPYRAAKAAVQPYRLSSAASGVEGGSILVSIDKNGRVLSLEFTPGSGAFEGIQFETEDPNPSPGSSSGSGSHSSRPKDPVDPDSPSAEPEAPRAPVEPDFPGQEPTPPDGPSAPGEPGVVPPSEGVGAGAEQTEEMSQGDAHREPASVLPPETGDGSCLWTALLLLSASGLAFLSLGGKRSSAGQDGSGTTEGPQDERQK